jgi:hypothetical protein
MMAEVLPLRLPPPGPERERVLANALLIAIQSIPRLEAAVERLEAAVLVASGAAARAVQTGDRLEILVKGKIGNGHAPEGQGKAETRASERPVSQHDLDEELDELRAEVKTSPGLIAAAVAAGVAAARPPEQRGDPISSLVVVIVRTVGKVVSHAAAKEIARWVATSAGVAGLVKLLHVVHWL